MCGADPPTKSTGHHVTNLRGAKPPIFRHTQIKCHSYHVFLYCHTHYMLLMVIHYMLKCFWVNSLFSPEFLFVYIQTSWCPIVIQICL